MRSSPPPELVRAPRTSVALVRAVLVLAVSGLVVLVGPIGVAQAHTSLVRTSPGDGATLDAPPTEIGLFFDEPVLAQGLGMVATTQDGSRIDLGVPTAAGANVRAAWPAGQPAGSYRVSWRVVADDGHPISGVLTFSYVATSPTAAATSGSASASPTEDVTTGPATDPSPATTGSPSPTNPVSSDGSTPAMVLAAVGVIGAATAGVIVLARRRGDSAP